MAEYRDRQKLTDDDVRAILISTDTRVEIARRVGCSLKIVGHYRERKSKRALRIARELGLPPLKAKWLYVEEDQEDRAYVVRGVRR